ncbi:MAG: hypothetical protein PHG61_12055 [Candidatus Marinimicrobia bacterium]|nr:hypothetical protein [Candidatus Neomarinimicrobiota bacterium]
MPTHDFVDIGDVLKHEFLEGEIVTVFPADDTCTVNIAGTIYSALLFWHSEPTSTLRSNGAIYGAAENFAAGDSVIVMKKVGASATGDCKVIYGGTKAGKVWVGGKNIWGCLGDGQDYQIVTYLIGYSGIEIEDEIELTWDGSFNRFITGYETTVYGDVVAVVDWAAYFAEFDRHIETRMDLLNSGYAITHSYYVGVVEHIIFVKSKVTNPIYQFSLQWPTVTAYKSLPAFNFSCKWACVDTTQGTSFIIASSGEMYCAGGNIYGQLGIGAATGWKWLDEGTGAFIAGTGDAYATDNPQFIPNYYSKVFVQVPGKWTSVVTAEGITYALDDNRKLWIAGKGYTPTFVKYSDDIWLTFIAGMFIKDNDEFYDIYQLAGSGTFSLLGSISKTDWVNMYGSCTPEDYARTLLARDNDENFIYIGGDFRDQLYNLNKPAGTLWRRYKDYGYSLQLMAGTTWFLAAGTIYCYGEYVGGAVVHVASRLMGGSSIILKG